MLTVLTQAAQIGLCEVGKPLKHENKKTTAFKIYFD